MTKDYIRVLNALTFNAKWGDVIGYEMQRLVGCKIACWDESGTCLIHREDIKTYCEYLDSLISKGTDGMLPFDRRREPFRV